MTKTFQEAMAHRRSYYALKNESPITDNEIIDIVHSAVKHVPSAFNSQSTRVVVLLHDKHQRVWEITKDVLREIVSAEAFGNTKNKIDSSFQSGYGTLLFYEDQRPVKALQEQFPRYADNFPIWSQHTNAMHQFAIWTMLEDAGFGVSVQHYNPLIDELVAKEFNIPAEWTLIAQMPFGAPAGEPGEKDYQPLSDRVLVP
ncbi:nitroreductase family protein [Prevotella corporis]|uniref:Nitroreductase family protein n=1 Tax=Prevotella corporis TaxID=28128 RepID=A0A133PXL3_9BACT|nr:nitroreductase family protein [Prevotella corporis]KXA34757.1 nitroreductase family protein [Prevotella corporis]